MNQADLEYICSNLSNLSGLPVRLYRQREQVYYVSPVFLPFDPFARETDSALSNEESISYWQSSSYYYYGIIRVEELSIVVGPTRQIPITKQELLSFAFSLEIPSGEYEEFVQQMQMLTPLPLFSLLQILCMVYFALTGEKRTIESITVHEASQLALELEMGQESAEATVESLEERQATPYNAFDTESRLMDMVMRGDMPALKEYLSSIPPVRSGTVAQEMIRQSKNIFIVTATLVSRAAIRGGMDVSASLSLSDLYIQKCELAQSEEAITELNYRMVIDYCQRMEQLRFGKEPSKLALSVANYVQKHLSEPIKTKDIADALFMGRSRLSTNFKAETGIELSRFVAMMKIDEAKRLLRYSHKPIVSIALYLGFSSQSHFSKAFKSLTGVSPNEYRLLHKRF